MSRLDIFIEALIAESSLNPDLDLATVLRYAQGRLEDHDKSQIQEDDAALNAALYENRYGSSE